MEVTYKPNVLTHWSETDSLYYTPIYQKLWHMIDFIYFRNFCTSMAMQVPAIIPMMAKELLPLSMLFYLNDILS